jgi:hypothetical protein
VLGGDRVILSIRGSVRCSVRIRVWLRLWIGLGSGLVLVIWLELVLG